MKKHEPTQTNRLRCMWAPCLLVMVAAILSPPAAPAQDAEPTANPSVQAEPAPQAASPIAPGGKAADQQPADEKAANEQASPASIEPTPGTLATPDVAAQPVPATKATDQLSGPGGYFGLWVIMPAIAAILLAIFTRQVVPALVVGVVVGAYMMIACPVPAPGLPDYGDTHSVVGGFRLAFEHYILGEIIDSDDGFGHAKIMMFTLIIGFTVGVIGRNGGTRGMVRLIAGQTESARRGGFTAWLAGLVVFFDDYANTMIVGPTMRSVFDRVRLSRAKLAYIVDSTAAPVASLALIGTWVGAEIGFINQGLSKLTPDSAPEFLLNRVEDSVSVMGGMDAFIASLPYRFYPILALFLVLVIALTRRDFGPMRRSENRAYAGEEPHGQAGTLTSSDQDDAPPRWWLGLLPILVLVGATMAVLWVTGASTEAVKAALLDPDLTRWDKVLAVMGEADAYLSIFYGAVLSAISAVLLTMLARAASTKACVEAGLDGMARMFPAVVILILAWALSEVSQNLMLGEVVAHRLEAISFTFEWLPLAIFVTAAVISFATGTSWGTMGILCPLVVTIAVNLGGADSGIDVETARTLFFASIGSVLAGAIFGDHCSPISDTTVLSSIASGCPHEEHVWTQLPYALVAAVAAMGLGDVMCSVYGQPWYYGLGAGAAALILIVLIFGRTPKLPPTPLQAIPPAQSVVPLGQ